MLIGGTASATVPFIALAARQHGLGGAAMLCLLASLIMVAFGLLRLGRYITRVPHAVVSGFSCGIGGMMLVSQLDIILGVSSPLTRAAGSTLSQLVAVSQHLMETRMVPLVLGLMVILAATFSARFSHHLPAPLIGVALAILMARFFGWREKEVGFLSPAYLRWRRSRSARGTFWFCCPRRWRWPSFRRSTS